MRSEHKSKPSQLTDLLSKIKICVNNQKYTQTKHALVRQNQRHILLEDALYVLKNGYHEKRKTSFDEIHSTWKYAIRGKTIENVDIRVIVAFDEDYMLIITVMEVT